MELRVKSAATGKKSLLVLNDENCVFLSDADLEQVKLDVTSPLVAAQQKYRQEGVFVPYADKSDSI